MEFLVPFMPMMATLPLAAGATLIVYLVLRHLRRNSASEAQLEEFRRELEVLRASHAELQERVDFTERLLGQVREAAQSGRALP